MSLIIAGSCDVLSAEETVASADLLPRRIATIPVRTISRIPYGRSTSSSLSILSSPPVISIVNDSVETSTTRARKTLASSSTWERAPCVAATRIMARSTYDCGLIGDVLDQ